MLEADIKTISRQIISIVTQVKRDRESKQQNDAAVKDSAHGAVQAPQSVPVGSVTSSSTSLPQPAAAAAAPTQQTRVAAVQPPAAPAAVTSPTALPAAGPAQPVVVENTSSAQTNGLPVSSAAAPVASILPSVVTVAGQTAVTASVTVAPTPQPPQTTQVKPPTGLLNCTSVFCIH